MLLRYAVQEGVEASNFQMCCAHFGVLCSLLVPLSQYHVFFSSPLPTLSGLAPSLLSPSGSTSPTNGLEHLAWANTLEMQITLTAM